MTGTISVDITGTTFSGTLNLDVTGLTLPATDFTGGKDDCGALTATDTVTELGETVTADVTGTIADGKGTGTWTAKSSDGLINASGTFTASK